MAEFRAWIRADVEEGFGSLHQVRAIALAEAAKRDSFKEIVLITRSPGEETTSPLLPEGVELVVWGKDVQASGEAARLADLVRPHVPKRIDSRNPRPLVYLCGPLFDEDYQRTLWRAGAEVVVISDVAGTTFADWYIVPKPYGGELEIPSKSGYTRFLRGAQYAPLRMETIRAICSNRIHRTSAVRFAVATEGLFAAYWLPKISAAVEQVAAPDYIDSGWKPKLTILPGLNCPGDEDLGKLAGKGLEVSVHRDRRHFIDALHDTDLLFAPDGVILQDSLALGVPRVVLPRSGVNPDLMFEHLVRRDATIQIPDPEDKEFSSRLAGSLGRMVFDPAYRRAQGRIGQNLCDGLGSIRIIRQTAFKEYVVPQNVTRFFETGDPMIREL